MRESLSFFETERRESSSGFHLTEEGERVALNFLWVSHEREQVSFSRVGFVWNEEVEGRLGTKRGETREQRESESEREESFRRGREELLGSWREGSKRGISTPHQ